MKDLNNQPLPTKYIPEGVHTDVLRKVMSGDVYEVYNHWIASGHTIDMFQNKIKALEKQIEDLKND